MLPLCEGGVPITCVDQLKVTSVQRETASDMLSARLIILKCRSRIGKFTEAMIGPEMSGSSYEWHYGLSSQKPRRTNNRPSKGSGD